MLLLNLSNFARKILHRLDFHIANTTTMCKVLFIISLIDQNTYLNSADSKPEKHSEKIKRRKCLFTNTIAVKNRNNKEMPNK